MENSVGYPKTMKMKNKKKKKKRNFIRIGFITIFRKAEKEGVNGLLYDATPFFVMFFEYAGNWP